MNDNNNDEFNQIINNLKQSGEPDIETRLNSGEAILIPTTPRELRKLPRYDLREPAFRAYERYIVKCYLTGTYPLSPRVERLKHNERYINAHSWTVRCRDAIRAFMRYHYHCSAIPAGTDISYIKVEELEEGMVRMRNTRMDDQIISQASTLAPTPIPSTPGVFNPSRITEFIKRLDLEHDERIAQYQKTNKDPFIDRDLLRLIVPWYTHDDKLYLLNLKQNADTENYTITLDETKNIAILEQVG